jgi:UDP-galactopyranose mutase
VRPRRILVVGAGVYGATCAYEFARAGYEVRVVERRPHVGGNCFTRWNAEAECHEHVYGAHIFHTNSRRIWDWVTQFADFNHYVNRVKVHWRGRLYSFPINLFTLYQLFGATSPAEAEAELARRRVPCAAPTSMEEYALSMVGREIYETFIEGYTTKQWNTHPRQLPASILKRIPIRLTHDDNYFNDRFQGIPIGGYTAIFDKLLAGIPVELGVDFLADRDWWLARADYVVYTGPIDAWFGRELGVLGYRSLRFETELLDVPDFQGNAVVNYTDAAVPWTRILEHKHFDLSLRGRKTLVTREYPADWSPGQTEYYPLVDDANRALYRRYAELAKGERGRVHFGGRLGAFQYYDMHQVIGAALAFVGRFVAGETDVSAVDPAEAGA